MKNISYKICKHDRGFSLAEVLTSLVIGSMVLVAMLGIYSRVQKSSAAITRSLGSSRLPSEILHRIAEDLDRIIASGSDTRVTVENKFEEGYPTARLTIVKTIKDRRNRQQDLEKIIWQSSYDFENDANGLVLYRSHGGIGLEDKLLDENKKSWEKELFVPICSGLTLFRIQIPRGENLLNRWSGTSLPPAVVVTISFAEPFETLAGTLDVPDAEKITRTIAIDRTRKIKFTIAKEEYGGKEETLRNEEKGKKDEEKENTEDKKEDVDAERKSIDAKEKEYRKSRESQRNEQRQFGQRQ